MMMKSVFWWRKPEYPEETTDLRQVTVENFHFLISRLAWMIEDLSILISCIIMSVSDNSATNSAALGINLSALTKLSAFLLTPPPTPSHGPLPWPASSQDHVARIEKRARNLDL